MYERLFLRQAVFSAGFRPATYDQYVSVETLVRPCLSNKLPAHTHQYWLVYSFIAV